MKTSEKPSTKASDVVKTRLRPAREASVPVVSRISSSETPEMNER